MLRLASLGMDFLGSCRPPSATLPRLPLGGINDVWSALGPGMLACRSNFFRVLGHDCHCE